MNTEPRGGGWNCLLLGTAAELDPVSFVLRNWGERTLESRLSLFSLSVQIPLPQLASQTDSLQIGVGDIFTLNFTGSSPLSPPSKPCDWLSLKRS